MKKSILMICAALLLITTPFMAEAKENAVVVLEQKDQNTMIPVRETAEALGMKVTWEDETQTVTISDDFTTATLDMKQKTYAISDSTIVEMEPLPELLKEKVYVPLSFFESFFFVEQEEKEDNTVSLHTVTPEEPTVLGEFAKLKDGDWTGLTKEQKQEDLEYLYQILAENYPYFGVLNRMYAVDFQTEYTAAKQQIAESQTDAAFYSALEMLIRKANMVGHLSVISPFDYNWYANAYQNTVGIPEEYLEQMKKLADVYGNPFSQKTYTALEQKILPVYQKVQDYYAKIEPQGESTTETTPANVRTEILEKGKIAYIYVGSFDMAYYEEDKEKLFDFYETVKTYDHVIFDFTENGGGGMSYFEDLIAAPNIDKTLSVKAYGLMKEGEHNLSFLEGEEFVPISELPQLPRMNNEDREALDLMTLADYTVAPSREEKILQGKIWLLVNENVFSSSEYAAMFSKATGFATLVGSETGGDGIGSDPLPIVLPNSGLMIRYSPIYGVTPDGAGSQEFGTTPDIVTALGKTELETCLDEIEKMKQK